MQHCPRVQPDAYLPSLRMTATPLEAALFVVAAALSLAASAVLVSRLERVCARLGLSAALLGLFAALAADTPEITSAVSALLSGQHAIGTGVVLGSRRSAPGSPYPR